MGFLKIARIKQFIQKTYGKDKITMDLFEAIEKRRTTRDFESKDIDDKDLVKIIEAAMKAPTNDHMRDWHFVVIKDKAVIMKLLDIIPKGISEEDMENLIKDWNLQDHEQQGCYRNAVPKQHKMFADASAMIIPLLKKKVDIMHPQNLSHLNGFASIWCSIENIYLATTALGYGLSLRIPLGDEDLHAKEVLGFPDDYLLPCFLGIGYPKKDAPVIKQKDIDVKDRLHWNKW